MSDSVVETSGVTLPRGLFALVFAISLTMAIGNTGLISIMPAIGRSIGVSDHLIAGIFSMSALLWAITSSFWARVSDEHGRKPMMLLGLAGFLVSMLGCATIVWAGLNAMLAPFSVFLAFAAMRALFGLTGSASASASQAFVADRTSALTRTRALAALAGALGLGTILGPALSPFLVFEPLGLSGPMLIFALGVTPILALVALAIPSGRPPHSLAVAGRPERAKRIGISIWRNGEVSPFLWFGLLVAGVQAVNVYTLGFVVMDATAGSPELKQTHVGIAMAAGAAVGLLCQWGAIPALKMSPKILLRVGGVLALLGNVIMAFSSHTIGLALGYVVATAGFSFCRPGFTAGASIAASAEQQGAVAGAVSGLSGAAIVFTPVLGVLLYEFWRPSPFVLNAVLMAGLLVYAAFNQALRRSPLVFA